MPYATRDDVYLLGLGAQAFVVRPRPLNTTLDVDTATGVIRLVAHGLTDEDILTTPVTSGGSLATGLTAFTPYNPAVVSGDLFRIVNPATGSPFTSFVSAGSGWAIAVDQLRRLDRHLTAAAADIDDQMTAYAPPFEVDPVTGLYSQRLINLNARLAAWNASITLQFDNAEARIAVDRLEKQIERDWVQLETYLKGRPLNPAAPDQTTTAENGARATRSRAPLNWTTGSM